MKVRSRSLPPGWYPVSMEDTQSMIQDFINRFSIEKETVNSGIVPHAGWGFSGSIACEVISKCSQNNDTIIVVGGHLGAGDTVLAAFEDAFKTPIGTLDADTRFLNELKKEINIQEDIYSDNTVEVQLPFIKYFYPQIKVVGMRVSPSEIAVELGKVIYMTAEKFGKNVIVLGSTDLTHYGRNYGFSPKGTGEKAVKWVKEVNDSNFIDALLKMDSSEALLLARKNFSACSAGGAVCALSFAKEKGIKKGKLIRYQTSWDIYPSDSFVGYAGIIY